MININFLVVDLLFSFCLCEISNGLPNQVYFSQEGSLLNTQQVITSGEQPLAGGEEHQDPTDPQYKALAEESLRKYVVDSGITEPLVVALVEKVTTQVAAGILTRLDFLVSGSSDSSTTKCHSKVWEPAWLNKKEITVTCQNDGHRSKRQLVGGLTERDPTDPQYKALAEESLRKYVVDSGITEPLVVALVEKVTTQLVAGTMTRLDFLVSGSSDPTTVKCHSEVWEQAWLNKKQIDVTCQNDGHRSKRQSSGGLTEQDPTYPKYKALAEESLRKYVIDSGITQPLVVALVEKVFTQVAAGILTRLDFLVSGSSDSSTIKCHSKVWEQAWLNKKEIDVTCQNDGHRSKRQLAGGLTEQDPTDPQYKALAEESLRKYVVDSGITEPLVVALVEKVTTQIVSGELTRLDFLVSGSADSSIIKCHSKVWEQAWLNKRGIDVTCQNDGHRSKRGVPGGLTERDPTDPQYKALAEESLRKYVVDSGITEPLVVALVEKVTTQIVSGELTRLDFLVSGSADSSILKCHSKVWEQAWLNKRGIDVTCQNDGHRSKRQLLGGLTEQDPTDPQYKALAEESLRKYVVDSGITEPLVVALVEKVTTQLVAGTMTRLDFLVSGSSDPTTVKCHSEVWEQAWLNKKQIDVTCQNDGHRSKRGVPGGLTERDPTDPQYKALAEESLRKYVVDSGITEPLVVALVEKVTTQIVSGELTRLDFLVSGSADSSIIKCHSKVWEQAWLNKRGIDVTCQNDGHRSKRGVPGGLTERDPTDPQYKALAEESLRKYVVDSGITEPLVVALVEKVTTQIVSGELTRLDFLVSGSADSSILKCHSKVWEQAWLNKRGIDVTCQNDGHRSKRQLLGGLTEQDPTDPQYKALAEESLRKYVVDSGITEPLVVALVEKVTTQLVAGTMTRLDFLVSGSSDPTTVKCHSEVWEQAWLNKKQIDVTCQNDGHRSKRGVPGGLTERDPTDPQYKALAEESLRKYVVDSGITEPLVVALVEKVTTQIVSGELTRLDFLVSGSADSSILKCHSKVWEQAWLNKRGIDVTCQNDGHRSKRQLLGGLTEQDPTDPQYKALAEESLRKYVVDSGITEPLVVALVEKVTTQLVAGMMTRLDFLVSGSSDPTTVKCHSEVWEQAWLNKKQIDVTCQNDGHRSKRGVPGGLTERDPTDPQYKALAEESLRKYVVDSGITEPLVVALVEKVTTQIVSGELTRLDFLVSGSADSSILKCHSKVWEQAWLNKRGIDVTCQNDGHRSKRQLLGGLTEQDPTDPQYKALAEESLRKYVVDSGITEPLVVALVEKVTTQLVAGTMTRLDFLVSGSSDPTTVKCHSEVWEQAWLNKKQIDVTCQNDGHRSKRGVPGGLTERDPTDPQYKALAEESLRKYVVDSGITEPLVVALVEKVTTQIVSGELTRLDFLVSGSADSSILKCHSKVWEQAWLNKRGIDVTCQNDGHRSKRQLLGGLTEQDPTDSQYKALAEESLRKYVVDSGITEPLVVALVEKVTTQLVAGTMTRLDFLVSGSSDPTTVKCHSEVWEQAWLNKKQIDVTCQNDGHRSKRGVPGGLTERDPTDPQYKALAEESLRKYVVDSGITEPLVVALVEKVTTQIVSGELTRLDFLVSGSADSSILKCHSKVWEQAWLNKRGIDVTCQNDGHRSKRQLLGGLTEQDPTDPQYKALAEESLRKYVVDSGITEPLVVALVEKVTTQLVAGTMTRLDFLVSGSSDPTTVKCHSEVWEQAWLNKKQIDVTCQNDGHRSKRGVPGGLTERDPTDPKYKALAEESLRKYMVDSGITQPLVVAVVEKVSTQVVSGELTRLDFLVSGSADSSILKCHSKVWEQAWLNKRGIDVTCQNDGHRSKKTSMGGPTEQDPTDPQYKALAEESLRKYMVDSGITQPLVVAVVEKVSTQVVSGELTRLDFLVSGSADSSILKCHSKVWKQAWLNKKKIDVTCQNDGHRSKKPSMGGLTEQDPTDPQYKALAEESLRKYMVDSGITQPLVVAVVEKVSTQVVSGELTRLDFLVSGSADSSILKCHSKVWKQSWLNKKQIDVTCQNDGHRSKKTSVGGPTEQDPTDPQYKALAEESLRKYMVDSGIKQPLVVAVVEKVSTQVVSGELTRLDFLVSGSADSSILKCHSKVWKQAWLNKKKIDVTCQNDGHRSKRPSPGGLTEQDPTDPKYKALAEESLRKYMVDSGITQPLVVAVVEKVSTQVVSGELTRLDFLVSGSADSSILKCHSKVWKQAWLNKKKIDVTCQNDGHKSKRPSPGGLTEQDPTDPKYKALAEESLRKYMVDSGITQPLVVAVVEKVSTQVVSGKLTRLDFLVSGSADSSILKCHSKVWKQAWLNKKKIDVTCQNDGHRSKRPSPGGLTEQDPTDPKYKALAEESLRKYMVDSGITQPLVVAVVEKVSTQVVSGELTRLDFLVSGSADSSILKCHSKVWKQAWPNKKKIDVTCQNDGHRSKRPSPGGLTEQDPTDPKYKALAEESLRKYVVDSSITEPLVVALVEKVTTQVAAGILTRLDFLVSGSSDSSTTKCHSQVWEPAWLNTKEIDVTCQNDGQRGKRRVPVV